MKKTLWFFIPLLLIFVIGFQWSRNVRGNLITLDEKVNTSLKSLIGEIEKRYNYLDSVLNLDTLSKENTKLKNYITWRSTKNDIVSFQYLDMEYQFDSLFIKLTEGKEDIYAELLMQKKEFDAKLNDKVDQYNKALKDYYQYDLFPKSLVTNGLNIDKKKYFEFKYGEVSERPSLKDARTSKKIDSLLIKGLE